MLKPRRHIKISPHGDVCLDTAAAATGTCECSCDVAQLTSNNNVELLRCATNKIKVLTHYLTKVLSLV